MELLFLALLGGVTASFLNLVISRRSQGLSIVLPSSFCFSCKKPLKAWHLIPIFSYVFYRGRCPYCKAKIPFYYLLTEIFFSLLSPLIYLAADSFPDFILLSSSMSVLYLMSAQDLSEKAVSNSYFALLAIGATIKNFSMLWDRSYSLSVILFQIILFLLYLTARKSDKVPIGEGDLLAFCLLLSYFHSYYAIIFLGLSFWLALLAYILIKKLREDRKIALMPFITLSFVLTKLITYFINL